jgi:hypothetical protein
MNQETRRDRLPRPWDIRQVRRRSEGPHNLLWKHG